MVRACRALVPMFIFFGMVNAAYPQEPNAPIQVFTHQDFKLNIIVARLCELGTSMGGKVRIRGTHQNTRNEVQRFQFHGAIITDSAGQVAYANHPFAGVPISAGTVPPGESTGFDIFFAQVNDATGGFFQWPPFRADPVLKLVISYQYQPRPFESFVDTKPEFPNLRLAIVEKCW